MTDRRGDDLDDDFVPDDTYVQSDDADEVPSGGEASESEYFSDFEGSSFPQAEGQTAAGPSNVASSSKLALADKKRKRREKEKAKRLKKRKLVEAIGATQPLSITAQSPERLSQYLAEKQAKTFPKKTSVELDDMRILDEHMADTTTWPGPRTLDVLGDFIAKMLPTLATRLSQKSKHHGAPTALFVASGALRVTDVVRVFKNSRLRGEKSGDVAKLFARHIKLEDHATYLKRSKIAVAVGTPGRIGKLLCETDALSVSALSHIIFDVSFEDAKNRSLFDIPETRDEVLKFILGAPLIQERLKQGKLQLVFF